MRSPIRRRTFAGLALAALALATSSIAPAQQPRILRMGFSLAKEHPIGIGAQQFADLVAAKTGGKLKISTYPGAVLGGDPQNLSAIRGGTLDLTIMATGLLAGIEKPFMVFDLPFLVRNAEEAYAISDGPVATELMGKLADHGVVGLGIWDLGFRHITNSRRPIAKPEDIEGLKLRVIAAPVYIETFKALGANPVPMTFGEVYGALESRAIDGQDNPLAVIETAKFSEVQKYLSLTRHFYTGMPLLMSKKTWDSLSADEQSAIRAAAEEAKVEQRRATQSHETAALDRLRKAMQVNEVSTAEIERLRAKVEPVVRRFATEVGEPLFARVNGELARLRGK
jgi:tripartite ATP-independent transporter DctP family solute receptor